VFAHVSTDPTDSSAHSRDFVILAVLADQDAFSQQDLAERLDINRTIMVKLIDRLEQAGFVTRTRNPKNRRSYLPSPTHTGHRELAGIRRAATARDERFAAALAPPQRQRLNDLLRTLLGEHDQVMASSLVSSEYLISQVFYQLRRRGDAMLAGTGLRLRHFAPLFAIDRLGPGPQQQMASYLAITKP